MICVLCKSGETNAGKVNVVLSQGQATIIIKDVPAEICDNCGEHYLSDSVTQQVLIMAKKTVSKETEIEILKFVYLDEEA